MSHVFIAFLLGLGAAAFVYSKVTRRTGGIAKSDITLSVMAGLLAFFMLWSVLSIFAEK